VITERDCAADFVKAIQTVFDAPGLSKLPGCAHFHRTTRRCHPPATLDRFLVAGPDMRMASRFIKLLPVKFKGPSGPFFFFA